MGKEEAIFPQNIQILGCEFHRSESPTAQLTLFTAQNVSLDDNKPAASVMGAIPGQNRDPAGLGLTRSPSSGSQLCLAPRPPPGWAIQGPRC